LTKSDTKDPFFGIEAGRTYVAPSASFIGGEATDSVKATKAK